MKPVHAGQAAGSAAEPQPWSSALTSTDEEHIYIRGLALDEAIGRETFAGMVLRLWTGMAPSARDARLMDACLVAAIDHGPLSPSALVARTVTSTGAPAMTALAAGVATFGPLHGAVVTAAMRLLAEQGDDLEPPDWAHRLFERERAAGRRIPGVGHRWHRVDLRAERLLGMVVEHGDHGVYIARIRALADVVGEHARHPVAVNVDGALAAALSSLGVDPRYGDFVFATSRSAGLAAHIVEESVRQRPMRFIDPTAVTYDGPPPVSSPGEVRPHDGEV